MGLQVASAVGGRPNHVDQAVSTALIQGQRLIAIATGGTIDLCDGDLVLQQSLSFSAAFPASSSPRVTAVLLLSEGKIIAAAGPNVAVWERRKGTWHIHSSLQAGGTVRALASAGVMLIVGADVLSLWSLDPASRFPLWRKGYAEALEKPVQRIALSLDGTHLAAVAVGTSIVHTWRLTGDQIVPISDPWHPLPLIQLAWKPDNSALFTQTSDGTFRIWATMIDEPDFYALWASANHTPFAGKPSAPRPMASCWIDAQDLPSGSSTDADRLLTIFADGSIGITTVENVGRKPPTCIVQHFHVTILEAFARHQLAYLRFPVFYLDPADSHLRFVGRSVKGSLLLGDFAFLHSRPRLREIRRKPAHETVALETSPDRSTVWRLSSAGEVLLCDATSLQTQASGEVIAARLLRPLDNDRAVVFVESATPHLALLSRVGAKLRVLAEVDAPGETAMLQTLPDQRVAAIGRDGSTTTWRCIESGFTHVLSVPSTLSADLALLVSIPQGGTAHLEGDDTIVFDTGGRTKTKRKRPRLSAISERQHVALVTAGQQSDELSIWDTVASEFTSGLCYAQVFNEPIVALSWIFTSSRTPVLAVALRSRVFVISVHRRRYLSHSSAWSVLASVSLQHITSSPITALTWSSSGSVIASTSNHLFRLASPSAASVLDDADVGSGPVPVYHPQLLQHCLLAGKAHLVDHVLLALHDALQWQTGDGPLAVPFDLYAFLGGFATDVPATTELGPPVPHTYASLTNGVLAHDEEAPEYNEQHAQRLIEQLRGDHPLPLARDEADQLAVIAQTAWDIKAQRRAIDIDGMRYLVALRTHALGAEARSSLHFRDILWAFHSQTQEILLQASVEACRGKMTWQQARTLGVFQWLRGHEALASHMEFVARSMYTASEDRDPISCSIFYFALRKRRLVHGLWKQAIGHSDRHNMLKFLINDFDEPRWRTAARKNAFSVLSKQRFGAPAAGSLPKDISSGLTELAVGFFLLGDSLGDAVNVCLKHLDDFPLAIALARIYEGGDDGPVLKRILETHIVPLALGQGHRWLASWAFWMLKRRDLAVRVIVTPFTELLPDLPMSIDAIGEPDTDDPALLLLFARLRDYSLQTIQGASLISIRTEFNFVLYMARILRQMGCHILALDLVCSWPFTRPERLTPPERSASPEPVMLRDRRPSVLGRRRSSLLGRRQSTIIADLQVPSTVVSRAPSPEPMVQLQGEPEAFKALAKQARKQVTQVAEFDMSSFGF